MRDQNLETMRSYKICILDLTEVKNKTSLHNITSLHLRKIGISIMLPRRLLQGSTLILAKAINLEHPPIAWFHRLHLGPNNHNILFKIASYHNMIQEHIKITNQLTILQDPQGQYQINQFIKVKDIVVLLLMVVNHHLLVILIITSLVHLIQTAFKISTLITLHLLISVVSSITRITQVLNPKVIQDQAAFHNPIAQASPHQQVLVHYRCTATKDITPFLRIIIIKQDVYQSFPWNQIWATIMCFTCKRKGLRRYAKRKEKKVYFDLLACVVLKIDSFTVVEDQLPKIVFVTKKEDSSAAKTKLPTPQKQKTLLSQNPNNLKLS